MKKMNFIIFFNVLFFLGCSVSKEVPHPNTPTGITKNERNNESELSDSEKSLVLLTTEKELGRIEASLKLYSKEQLNFRKRDSSPVITSLLQVGDKDRLLIFINAGLSIYHPENKANLKLSHDIEYINAFNYLNRYNKAYQKPNSPMSSATELQKLIVEKHTENITNIEKLILEDKPALALIEAKISMIDCANLTTSLIYRSHETDRSSVTRISQFLAQMKCQKSLNQQEVKALYDMEMHKLFQERFKNRDILNFLIKEQPLKDYMIDLSKSGFRISPFKLFAIAKMCTFSEQDMGSCNEPSESEVCNFPSKDEYDACVKEYNIPTTTFDLTYTRNGLRIAAFEFIWVMSKEAFSNVPVQVTNYMFGFDDVEKKWRESLRVELSSHPEEGQ